MNVKAEIVYQYIKVYQSQCFETSDSGQTKQNKQKKIRWLKIDYE